MTAIAAVGARCLLKCGTGKAAGGSGTEAESSSIPAGLLSPATHSQPRGVECAWECVVGRPQPPHTHILPPLCHQLEAAAAVAAAAVAAAAAAAGRCKKEVGGHGRHQPSVWCQLRLQPKDVEQEVVGDCRGGQADRQDRQADSMKGVVQAIPCSNR